MLPLDPGMLFGLKMGVCLATFLLAAAWLRRHVARIQSAHGLPPEGTSASEALRHYFGAHARGFEHERRLHHQTIRILARELQRLDADHPEARVALELLGEPTAPRLPAPCAETTQQRRLEAEGEPSCQRLA
jgi:hypothetical protein